MFSRWIYKHLLLPFQKASFCFGLHKWYISFEISILCQFNMKNPKKFKNCVSDDFSQTSVLSNSDKITARVHKTIFIIPTIFPTRMNKAHRSVRDEMIQFKWIFSITNLYYFSFVILIASIVNPVISINIFSIVLCSLCGDWTVMTRNGMKF
mgnify:CR=1 FL=1